MFQRDYGETGLRSVSPLVLAFVDRGTNPGLFGVLNGQDPVPDRKTVPYGQILETPGALAANVVVMRCLTPDHTAERDITVVFDPAVLGSAVGRAMAAGISKRWNRNPVPTGTNFRQSPLGTSDEFVGNIVVEPSFDNEDVRHGVSPLPVPRTALRSATADRSR